MGASECRENRADLASPSVKGAKPPAFFGSQISPLHSTLFLVTAGLHPAGFMEDQKNSVSTATAHINPISLNPHFEWYPEVIMPSGAPKLVLAAALAALFFAGCTQPQPAPTPAASASPTASAAPSPTAVPTPASTPTASAAQYPGGAIEEAIEKALA